MANRKRYHVTPKGEHWQVKGAGAKRAVGIHDTQGEALAQAQRIAKNQREAQVYVHRPNGQIREERTYGGSDPYPPKG